MGILDMASKLTEIVCLVANQKSITEEEAWDEAIEIFKDRYEHEHME